MSSTFLYTVSIDTQNRLMFLAQAHHTGILREIWVIRIGKIFKRFDDVLRGKYFRIFGNSISKSIFLYISKNKSKNQLYKITTSRLKRAHLNSQHILIESCTGTKHFAHIRCPAVHHQEGKGRGCWCGLEEQAVVSTEGEPPRQRRARGTRAVGSAGRWQCGDARRRCVSKHRGLGRSFDEPPETCRAGGLAASTTAKQRRRTRQPAVVGWR